MPKHTRLVTLIVVLVVMVGSHPPRAGRAQPTTPVIIDALAWSPDGSTLAFTQIHADAYAHTLWLLDVEQQQTTPLAPTAPDVFMPQWSADGAWLAFVTLVDPIGVAMVSADNTRYVDLTAGLGPFLPRVAWSPTENWVAGIETSQGDLWLLRPDDPLNLTAEVRWPVTDFQWSPDGKSIAFSTTTPTATTLLRVNVATGEVETLRQIEVSQRTFYPDWTPDGTKVSYVIAEDATTAGLWLHDAQRGIHRRIYSGLTRQPLWANHALQVLVPTATEWLILDSEGQQVAALELPPNSQARGWSPDDRLLLAQFTDGRGVEYARLIEVATQRVVDEGVGSLATFAPDGATIAFVEYVNRSVYISRYQVADGQQTRLWEITP